MKRLLFVAWSFLISFSCKNAVQQDPPNGADTTSHSIVWQIDAFGDGSSSILNDVAIINDTLAYAVGEVYKRDSLGNWEPLPYNMAKWNGRNWELKRVTVMTRFGLITVPLEGILSFSPTDIWLFATDPIHGNGETWTDFDIRLLVHDENVTVSKGWGTSSSDMHVVGRNGTIIHHENGNWNKVSSGTTAKINDIWGIVEPTGKKTILLATSNRYSAGEKKLLSINPAGGLDSLAWTPGSKLNTVGLP